MTLPTATRMLFLDDSGHPAPNDASGAIVIGGLAVRSEAVPVLSRRITGAKGRLFPGRGHPANWEIKATDTIRPNPQRSRRNRELVQEILKIIDGLDSHASHSVASYTATQRLPIHPTVYYADSATSPAIQVADIITGVRRRAIEGDVAMQVLDNDLAGFQSISLAGRRTHRGRHWRNRIVVL